MPRGFRSNILHTPAPPIIVLTPPPPKIQAQRVGGATVFSHQLAVQNPSSIPHLQVVPVFFLRHSMEKSAGTTGTPVLLTYNSRQFFFSYHLKGVCNSNWGRRHVHRTLSLYKDRVLSAWKSQFCTAPPPVTKVSAPLWLPGGGSVGNTTISTKSLSTQGSHSAVGNTNT